MTVSKCLSLFRKLFDWVPSLAWYGLLWWMYVPKSLRERAATTYSPRVRRLLLERTGVTVGRDVHVGHGVLVLGVRKEPVPVVLGDRSAIGPRVTFVAASYPDMSCLRECPELKEGFTFGSTITVGEDVWIGANAVILPGVSIGRGAVIGAGAVVRSDVSAWTVVAGVPARRIRAITPPGDDAGDRAGSPRSGDEACS
jgi:acetyltransferase-like isoleucine patch superfamily enzyme